MKTINIYICTIAVIAYSMIAIPSFGDTTEYPKNPYSDLNAGVTTQPFGWNGTIFWGRPLMINSMQAVEAFRSMERMHEVSSSGHSAEIDALNKQIEFLQNQNNVLLNSILENKK